MKASTRLMRCIAFTVLVFTLEAIVALAAVGQKIPLDRSGIVSGSTAIREVDLLLPDAPSSVKRAEMDAFSNSPVNSSGFVSGSYLQVADGPLAPLHSTRIAPEWRGRQLAVRDKCLMSVEEMYNWQSLAGYVVAGVYAHVTNGEPNYGTDSGAFASRIGAAALRDSSEDLFADGIFASAFHQDPRYYLEGNDYRLVHRVFYAVTRPLITRSDHGHRQINASLLVGYLASSALTSAYYPQSNRNAADVARTFGSSLGGAAAGAVFKEFIGDIGEALHPKLWPKPYL